MYSVVHMASTELIDIVDENNEVIGSTDAETAHDQKLMHRVVGVFVFATDGDLYLQKGNKYGKLDLSVGGHVQKGESYENAAQREMFEELGLTAPLNHISTFFPKDARLSHYWAIYEATASPEWKFEETEEVKLLEKLDIASVIAMMKSNPATFTHGFINTMKELIRVKEL